MKTLQDRFESKVFRVPEAGCWLWTGGCDPKGYGHFHVRMTEKGKIQTVAHRMAYELYIGPIPEGLDLDHLCRVPACVNPYHLDPVTRQVNLMRGNPGAWMKQRAELPTCRNGHEYPNPPKRNRSGARICSSCAVDADRRYRSKRHGH